MAFEWKLTMNRIRKLSFAAVAVLLAASTPARADEVTSLLDQGTYYVKLATSSLDLAKRVSARKEKCQWARQSRGELVRGLDYYDQAERKANVSPAWSPADRARLSEMVLKWRGMLTKSDELISQLC